MKTKDRIVLIEDAIHQDDERMPNSLRRELERAGLDEPNPMDSAFKSGVCEYCNWFYDGDMPEWNDT